MVLVNAAHSAGGGERLEHSVSPASVAMLQRLHNLQVQVDVDQVSDLQATRVPVPILLTWGGIMSSLNKDKHNRAACCYKRLSHSTKSQKLQAKDMEEGSHGRADRQSEWN